MVIELLKKTFIILSKHTPEKMKNICGNRSSHQNNSFNSGISKGKWSKLKNSMKGYNLWSYEFMKKVMKKASESVIKKNFMTISKKKLPWSTRSPCFSNKTHKQCFRYFSSWKQQYLLENDIIPNIFPNIPNSFNQ